jgi:hypothetical protein
MNKIEIAAALRQEVGELEVSIKKVEAKCEKLKRFVLALEAENEPANQQVRSPLDNSKFRKVIDSVFGEKPKRRKTQ